MNKTISTTRLYSLSQYNSLHLSESSENIDDNLSSNPILMQKLRFLQFLNLERDYREYIILVNKLSGMSPQEALEQISALKMDTYEEITKHIKEI